MYNWLRQAVFFFYIVICFSINAAETDPVTFYLTWQRSPETTMTIQWVTQASRPTNELFFKQHGSKDWYSVQGHITPMPDKQPYRIHKLELTKLQPDTSYEFKIGAEGTIYKFRTMPAVLTKPIRFVEGGDFFHPKGSIEILRKMNRLAASLDPQFILCGGDLVYAENVSGVSSIKPIDRWLEWLMAWKEDMIAPDGRVIPMIPVIGNHEVKNGGNGRPPSDAPYFYSLFAFPGWQGYNVIDFGNYMTFVGMDSGHTHPVPGPQTIWLNRTLKERSAIPYKFVIYHVAAFPSVRKWDGKISEQIRKHWVPLFEEYGVDAVYENHDHAYKRSKPIKRGAIDPSGVLYIGDGGWAIDAPRTPKDPEDTWYLAKTASSRNMSITIVAQDSLHFFAYDENGKILDEYIKHFKNN